MKRILSLLLAVLMILGCISISVNAEDGIVVPGNTEAVSSAGSMSSPGSGTQGESGSAPVQEVVPASGKEQTSESLPEAADGTDGASKPTATMAPDSGNVPEPATESTAAPDSGTPEESLPAATAEAKPEATTEPIPENTNEPTIGSTSEPTAEATPEATAETMPGATVEPTPEAEATPEATAEATPEATAEATPEATAEATPEATAETTPEATVEATPEITIGVTPEATVEPTPEAEATPEATVEPTPEAEATPEATAEAAAEPSIEPSVSPSIEPSVEPSIEPTTDPTAAPMVTVSPRNLYSTWYGVEPSGEQGMRIPVVFQTDYPEIVCIIRGVPRSVSSSGCAATSLSMVIAYLTGNTQQTPYTLFCDAYDSGRYQGAGWNHETLSHYAAKYRIKSKWIKNDGDAIIKALKEGKPVIAHMGPGIFTSRGHYVVLRGVTEDGKILINDPVSSYKCKRAFPVQTLLTQARNDQAFMVCWN